MNEKPEYKKQQDRDLESVRRIATKIELMLGQLAVKDES